MKNIMDKVLIIGAKGMLGYELAKVFTKYNPILWSRDDIDITKKLEVYKKISKLAPELIINAAAYTNVDACEENEKIAIKVNGIAVGYLAEIARKLDATLVHYSTDYVFDGNKEQGYVENDKPDPINAYGRSKLVGETVILNEAKQVKGFYEGDQNYGLKFYIIRTSWLYGVHGKNFVETILSLAKQDKPIKVVNDQFGSPTYALDLAQATFDIIESKKTFGIYHRTNKGQTSWYEFAKEAFEVFEYTMSLQEGVPATTEISSRNQKVVDLSACSTKEYPTLAKRPKYSFMKSTKLEPMRSWQDALKDYKESKNI